MNIVTSDCFSGAHLHHLVGNKSHRYAKQTQKSGKQMKTEEINSIHRLFLMVPMISWIGLTACSHLAGTAGAKNLGPYRVATYVDDSKPRSENRPADQDPGPDYEWFY
jgi:hypothetical protein